MDPVAQAAAAAGGGVPPGPAVANPAAAAAQAGAAAAIVQGGIHRLEKLTSTTPKAWRAFRKRLGLAIEINGWAEPRAKMELSAAMSGDAAEVTEHLMPTADPAQTYAVFLAQHEACFITPAAGDMARQEFANARQQSGESIRQWASRVRTLFLEAYPPPVGDPVNSPHLVEKFTLNLYNKEVLSHVLRHRPNNFPDAVQVAENETASAANIAQELSRRSGKGIHSLTGDGSGPSGGGAGGQIHSFGDRRNRVKGPCYRCQEMGHIKRECPLRKRGDGGGASRDYRDRRGGSRGGRGGGGGGRGGGSHGSSYFRGSGRAGRGGGGRGRGGGQINSLEKFAEQMIAMARDLSGDKGGERGEDDAAEDPPHAAGHDAEENWQGGGW